MQFFSPSTCARSDDFVNAVLQRIIVQASSSLLSAVAVAPLAIRKDLGSTPCTAQPRRLEEWVVLSARGLGTSILGLHEYMIERQKSFGALTHDSVTRGTVKYLWRGPMGNVRLKDSSVGLHLNLEHLCTSALYVTTYGFENHLI
ncbi:unnamed protein product [Bursaphelenchus okinawaensis]|uniref:Uncharacterized protein n=1 Tax=Bursaphelenchus okinawaensis TaxID=465554 RepID=A0A811KXV9_9BILA|nr:unnamed protein product [Bursaphelenchus okinawaensis]CAG9115185.1 unnamed protein product [Bursaphelenchus okinawaensis]